MLAVIAVFGGGVSGVRVEVSFRLDVFSSRAARTRDGVAILTPGYFDLSFRKMLAHVFGGFCGLPPNNEHTEQM